ncbi:MAG: glycosyltransferase family 4 protein [Anaerolineae bacterium]|nr:glycosyltransferase family 4 protein [Anaerolineae bacterium]
MSTKRNLLFVSAYSGIGGGESVQLNLMRALDPDRYTLHLVGPRDGPWPQAAQDSGATFHAIPYRGINTWFVPAIYQRFPISGKLADLARHLDIHAIHTDYHSLPFAVVAGRANRIPVIWNAMGWWFPAKPWQRRFFREDVTQIVAITQAVRDRWLGDRPFMPSDRIKIIVPGVDPDHFHPGVNGSTVREKLNIGPDVPLVCLIARFQRVKGHDIFLDMARRILAQMPDARFAIAGENVFGVSKDETYKRDILTGVQNDPVLHKKLTFLGFWDDAREVIAAADVVVCASRFESLGMVHLESMAMGCPVVSMNNGGPAETLVDGKTGYLVPPEAPDVLADRVIRLLRDPVLRARMGQAGRARVLEQFTAQGYAAQFAQVIEGLV